MTTKGMDLLISFEGLRLEAYLDSSGTPTIGVGSTFYENGQPVKMGDTISTEEAIRLCKSLVDSVFEKGVRDNLRVELEPHKIDALTSLCYNIGVEALKNSTVLRLINSNAPREDIEKAWRMWRMCKGVILQGLVARREAELNYYYSHEPVSYAVSPPIEAVQISGDTTTQPVEAPEGKFDFLYAPSFWSMFLGGIAMMFGEDGVITMPEVYQGLLALSVGFTGIYTINKNLKRFAQAIKTKNSN